MNTHETNAKNSVDLKLDKTINSSTLPSLDDDYNSTLKREKTGGEIAFDRTVYTGIGFGVNEASALVIADQFEHGAGKSLFKKTADWMVKTFKFGEKIAKNGKKITPHDSASNALMTASLLVSGTLLVWPMKWLEDHKAEIVKKFNHKIDGWKGKNLTEAEVIARDTEVERALACEPKQSWPSLLVGRAIAMVSTMTMSMFVFGPEGMKQVSNLSENLLTKRKISIEPIPHEGKPRTWAQRNAALAGVETLCCVVSSVVLEVSSKLFARTQKKQPVHNASLCTEVKAETANAPTEQNESDSSNEKCVPCLANKFKNKPFAAAKNYVNLVGQTEHSTLLAP